jgi:surfeit locus 1 family protein
MKLAVGSYVFAPGLVPTLMSLFFFGVFLYLARWQWHRADYKEQLHRQYAQGEHAAPLTVSAAASTGKDVAGFPVMFDGHFDEEHTMLLDNQVEKGVPGFQVLTLFHTEQNEAVLVERGWLPLGKDRQHFTPVPPLTQTVFHLRGKIYFPSARQFVLKEDDYTQMRWPLLVQKLDLKQLGTALGVELAPFVVRLDEGVVVEVGQQLPRHWQFIVISAEKSRGYAFQWFGMALVLLGFYLYFSVEKGSVDE